MPEKLPAWSSEMTLNHAALDFERRLERWQDKNRCLEHILCRWFSR
jgi:hypothetical protein